MLELIDINKSYEIRRDKFQKVLKDLNVVFPDQGFVAILGNSGGGKTTLLNIIGGLDEQYSGKICYNKEEIADHEQFRTDRIGFVFQEHNLIDHLNAVDNVILSMTDDMSEKKKNAQHILSEFGLKDYYHKKPRKLSGGQCQRVAIARMIAKDVDIIVCDEPTGSLDEETGQKIVELIKELSKERLVIFVTHNKKLANKYADYIVQISQGQAKVLSNDQSQKEGKKLRLISVLNTALMKTPLKSKLNTNELNDNKNHLILNTEDFKGRLNKRIISRSYHSNNTWLSTKNLLGRYPNTIKNILLITIMMVLVSLAIIMEGELFNRYIHENSVDEGIKTIILDIDDPLFSEIHDEFSSVKNVSFAAKGYSATIGVAATNYESTRIKSEAQLENITGNHYFEDILMAGRMPEASDEVLMTPWGAISLLGSLNIGGERLYDQYMTGEVTGEYVFSLVDYRKFIIAEYGYPRAKIVGLVSDAKLYEDTHKLYVIDGFIDLFSYPGGLDSDRIILYKNNLYRPAHDELLNASILDYRVTPDVKHVEMLDVVYNKMQSFLQLSKIALYMIIGIALISFVSLLITSLQERKYEIGLYRSKGYNKRNITRILGSEMFIIGIISILLVVSILFEFAYLFYQNVDYISEYKEVIETFNMFYIVSGLLVILSFFVVVIIYFGNTSILKKSIISNIKDI